MFSQVGVFRSLDDVAMGGSWEPSIAAPRFFFKISFLTSRAGASTARHASTCAASAGCRALKEEVLRRTSLWKNSSLEAMLLVTLLLVRP